MTSLTYLELLVGVGREEDGENGVVPEGEHLVILELFYQAVEFARQQGVAVKHGWPVNVVHQTLNQFSFQLSFTSTSSFIYLPARTKLYLCVDINFLLSRSPMRVSSMYKYLIQWRTTFPADSHTSASQLFCLVYIGQLQFAIAVCIMQMEHSNFKSRRPSEF